MYGERERGPEDRERRMMKERREMVETSLTDTQMENTTRRKYGEEQRHMIRKQQQREEASVV